MIRWIGWVTVHFTVIGGLLCAATAAITLLWMRALGARDPASPSSAALLSREQLRRASPAARAAAVGVLVLIAGVVLVFR